MVEINKIINGIHAMKAMRESLPDDMAASFPDAYPEWRAEKEYTTGERVVYGGALYKVLQDHTAEAGWTPAAAPSLFAPVLAGQGGTEVGEWQQPDSTSAYNTGDRCMYNGVIYESTIDNNVWSPADYPQGWRVVAE